MYVVGYVLVLLFTAVMAEGTDQAQNLVIFDENLGKSVCVTAPSATGLPWFLSLCVGNDPNQLVQVDWDVEKSSLCSVSGMCMERGAVGRRCEKDDAECKKSHWRVLNGTIEAASTRGYCLVASGSLVSEGTCNASNRLALLPDGAVFKLTFAYASAHERAILTCTGLMTWILNQEGATPEEIEKETARCYTTLTRFVPDDLPGAERAALRPLFEELLSDRDENRARRRLAIPLLPILGYLGGTANLYRIARSAYLTAVVVNDVIEFGKNMYDIYNYITGKAEEPETPRDYVSAGDFNQKLPIHTQHQIADNINQNPRIQESYDVAQWQKLEDGQAYLETALKEVATSQEEMFEELSGTLDTIQKDMKIGFTNVLEGQAANRKQLTALHTSVGQLKKMLGAYFLNQDKAKQLQQKLDTIRSAANFAQAAVGFLIPPEIRRQVGAVVNLGHTIVAAVLSGGFPPATIFNIGTSLIRGIQAFMGKDGPSEMQILQQQLFEMYQHMVKMINVVLDRLKAVLINQRRMERKLDLIITLVRYVADRVDVLDENVANYFETQLTLTLGIADIIQGLEDSKLKEELDAIVDELGLDNPDEKLLRPPSGERISEIASALAVQRDSPEYTAIVKGNLNPWDPVNHDVVKRAITGPSSAEARVPLSSRVDASSISASSLIAPSLVLLSPYSNLGILPSEGFDRLTAFRRALIFLEIIRRFSQLYAENAHQTFRVEKVLEPLRNTRTMYQNAGEFGIHNALQQYMAAWEAFDWQTEVDVVLKTRTLEVPESSWEYDDTPMFFNRTTRLWEFTKESKLSTPITWSRNSGNGLIDVRARNVLTMHLGTAAHYLIRKYGTKLFSRLLAGSPYQYDWIRWVYVLKDLPCVPVFGYDVWWRSQKTCSKNCEYTLFWESFIGSTGLSNLNKTKIVNAFDGRENTRAFRDCSTYHFGVWADKNASEFFGTNLAFTETCTEELVDNSTRQILAELITFQASKLLGPYNFVTKEYTNFKPLLDLLESDKAKTLEIAELILTSGLPREFFPSAPAKVKQLVTSTSSLDQARGAMRFLIKELTWIANPENLAEMASSWDNIKYAHSVFMEVQDFGNVVPHFLNQSKTNVQLLAQYLKDYADRMKEYDVDEVSFIESVEQEIKIAVQCALSGQQDCTMEAAQAALKAALDGKVTTDTNTASPTTPDHQNASSSVSISTTVLIMLMYILY